MPEGPGSEFGLRPFLMQGTSTVAYGSRTYGTGLYGGGDDTITVSPVVGVRVPVDIGLHFLEDSVRIHALEDHLRIHALEDHLQIGSVEAIIRKSSA